MEGFGLTGKAAVTDFIFKFNAKRKFDRRRNFGKELEKSLETLKKNLESDLFGEETVSIEWSAMRKTKLQTSRSPVWKTRNWVSSFESSRLFFW